MVANVDLSGHPRLDSKTLRSVVLEVGDEKLGVIGLTLALNYKWAAFDPKITGGDAADAVKTEVDRLSGEGVDKIILITHASYGADLSMAAKRTGVDVIVGGHSHPFLSNADPRAEGPYPRIYNGVAIVQASAYGAVLGELKVTFDDQGNVAEAVGEPIPHDADIVEDEAILSLIAGASAHVE